MLLGESVGFKVPRISSLNELIARFVRDNDGRPVAESV